MKHTRYFQIYWHKPKKGLIKIWMKLFLSYGQEYKILPTNQDIQMLLMLSVFIKIHFLNTSKYLRQKSANFLQMSVFKILISIGSRANHNKIKLKININILGKRFIIKFNNFLVKKIKFPLSKDCFWAILICF